jgi:hypothetical protein
MGIRHGGSGSGSGWGWGRARVGVGVRVGVRVGVGVGVGVGVAEGAQVDLPLCGRCGVLADDLLELVRRWQLPPPRLHLTYRHVLFLLDLILLPA